MLHRPACTSRKNQTIQRNNMRKRINHPLTTSLQITYLIYVFCIFSTACESTPSTSDNNTENNAQLDMEMVDQSSMDLPVDMESMVTIDQMVITEGDQDMMNGLDQMIVEEMDQTLPNILIEEIWDELRASIDQTELEEIVVIFGDHNGAQFVHEKGSTQRQPVPIASASKLMTAILILKIIDEGTVSLTDHPQQYLSWWTNDPTDPRSQVTLEQLLSFTSGFSGDSGLVGEGIPCVEDADTSLAECAQVIYEEFFGNEPGESFYYGPAHMHIAAAMVTAATGENWEGLFRRLLYEPLNMTSLTGYQIPSTDNPRASGGLISTPNNYAKVLTSLVNNELLSQESMQELTRDRTPIGTQFISVPSTADEHGDWHYALGCWRECTESEYSALCDEPGVVSSPGAFGFYPWVDQKNGYWGIISTVIRIRGASVTVPLGHAWYPRAKQALDLLNH